MKKVMFVLLALLVLVGISNAQPTEQVVTYRFGYAANAIDTIPGTDVNGGVGKGGWLYVGPWDVSYSLMVTDSANLYIYTDYADSGWAPAALSSGKYVGFQTVTYSATTDSMCTAITATYPTEDGVLVRELRGHGTDVIPGASWIRFRVKDPNVASVNATGTGEAYARLRVHIVRH